MERVRPEDGPIRDQNMSSY